MEVKKSKKEIAQFMDEHSPVTRENAREVIDYLLPRELEWSAHYAYYYTATLEISIAYKLLKKTEKAINFMEKHIKIFSSNYPLQYALISNLYYEYKQYSNIGGAFFTKSKVWEYENEVRFLHYAPQWKGDFKPIELPIK